ncbi:MAG: regulatory iron-sulfur-containing complex subunit RicT [Planctomycetota bacterium]|nr:regulatory iron-sulfur-containing complex subunit RicT [Planctomycetota bacterium]
MSDPTPEAGQTQPEPAQDQTVANPDAPQESETTETGAFVVVRYGLMRQIGQFHHNNEKTLSPGTKVVVRSERGVELGQVVASVGREPCRVCLTPQRLDDFLAASGPDYPFRRDGRVLRLANHQDIIDHRHLESSAREEGAYCRRQIQELKLDMKLVTVEHLLGGERIIFYFAAESRVDFRDLVRRLARQYRTRIEMCQVGARDEARLVGDYERCGQPCCCQGFLKKLKPISMRMAKTQKATLDPSKISGRCGRLMCCLRYEDSTYEELRKKLPKKGKWVRTEKLTGKVVDTQILTQLVRLALPNNTHAVVCNEEIVERDVEPPAVAEQETSRPRNAARPQPAEPAPRPVIPVAAATDAPADEAETAATAEAERGLRQRHEPAGEGQPARQAKKKRRRRSRRKKKTGDGAPQPQSGAGPSQQGQGRSSSSRRRRRRKKPKSP